MASEASAALIGGLLRRARAAASAEDRASCLKDITARP
jgi:hypothetical protein